MSRSANSEHLGTLPSRPMAFLQIDARRHRFGLEFLTKAVRLDPTNAAVHEGEGIPTIVPTRQVEPFADRQIELLNTLADRRVIAIGKTRLLTSEAVVTRARSGLDIGRGQTGLVEPRST
jgi:hypothetical protein